MFITGLLFVDVAVEQAGPKVSVVSSGRSAQTLRFLLDVGQLELLGQLVILQAQLELLRADAQQLLAPPPLPQRRPRGGQQEGLHLPHQASVQCQARQQHRSKLCTCIVYMHVHTCENASAVYIAWGCCSGSIT